MESLSTTEGALIALIASGDLEGLRLLVEDLDLEACRSLLLHSFETSYQMMTTPGIADFVAEVWTHPEAVVEIGRRLALGEE